MPVPYGQRYIQLYREEGALLITLIYLALSIGGILLHYRRVPEYYSEKKTYITLSWLVILEIAMIVLYSVRAILFLVQTPGAPPLRPEEMPPGKMKLRAPDYQAISSLLFLFYFSLFSRKQKIPADMVIREDKPEKYRKSGLDEAKIEKVHHDLKNFMETEKPYLDPDLTLNLLADRLSLSKHYLSQIINITR